MLPEFRRPKKYERNTLKKAKDYCLLFIRRNAFLVLVVVLMTIIVALLTATLLQHIATDIVVDCKVTHFEVINVTDSVLSVNRRLLTLSRSNTDSSSNSRSDSMTDSRSDSRTDSESVSISDSVSLSDSESNSESYYNISMENLIDPLWLFDYYCIFTRLDSHRQLTYKMTSMTLIADRVLYSQQSYYNSTYGKGTVHLCLYNTKNRVLVYYSEKQQTTNERTYETENILLGFIVVFLIFSLYLIYDRERKVNYEDLLYKTSEMNQYIEEYNMAGGFTEFSDAYSNESNAEIQLIEFSNSSNDNNDTKH